jgi:hypothetical protein
MRWAGAVLGPPAAVAAEVQAVNGCNLCESSLRLMQQRL